MKAFRTGVVVGKFYPPHKGHHYLIDTALAQCDRVFVLVAWSPDQLLPVDRRVACLRENHPAAEVRAVEDVVPPDDSAGWGAYTCRLLGAAPEAVFTSEDYGDPYAAAMGARHVMVDRERRIVPSRRYARSTRSSFPHRRRPRAHGNNEPLGRWPKGLNLVQSWGMAAADQHVLIVDDDRPVRDLEVAILQGSGYSTEAAEDGIVAIECLKRRRPDLVLLDLVMPGVDGWGVLEHIHTMAAPPPVVMVSGANEIVPPNHLTRYVTGYVFKPFNVAQLMRTCEAALALPRIIPASRSRKEPRRTFLVETTLVSDSGLPLATAQLLQVSRGGFRLEIAIPLQTGDAVRVSFRVPGRAEPLTLRGHVRWRQDFTLGAQIDDLSEEEEHLLMQLLEPSEE